MTLLARSRAQAGLLGVVLVVLVAGLTVLASCALLLTTGADRARQSALAATPAADLRVDVELTDLPADPAGEAAGAGAELTAALAPLDPRLSTWTTSTLRDLPAGPDGRRLGWLTGVDDLTARADLVAGSWPGAPAGAAWPAALPVAAAEALGLQVGDVVELAPGTGLEGAAETAPVTVQVVGLVQPRAGAWDRDRLAGAGAVPDLEFGVFGSLRLPAAGPFLVDPATLLAAGPGVERVALRAAPDVVVVPADLADRLAGLPGAVRAATEGTSRVVDPLAGTLAGVAAQQAGTRGAVLAVAVLAGAVTLVALGTAARVLGDRRRGETALLRTRGGTRRQLAARALPEATVLALAAATVALPLAALAARVVLADRLPGSVPGALLPAAAVLPVLAAALVLAVGLAVLATRQPAPGRAAPRGALARSGADLLLAGLAALAVASLTDRTGADPALVGAPVLVLAAGTALSLRLPPLLARLADRRAVRGDRLVPVLVAGDLARRPLASGAAALLVLATAAVVAAAGVHATWAVSRTDQADLRVGTDLAVPADGLDGAAVREGTGGTVSPVLERAVSSGSVLRTDGAAPRLVAVDTAVAGEVLRGRLPAGQDWGSATAGLVPGPAPAGVPGPGAVTVTGSAGRQPVSVTTTVLLAGDLPVVVTGAITPLDGAPHDAGVAVPAGGAVVGVVLDVAVDEVVVDPEATVPVTVEVDLPAAAAGWSVAVPGTDGGVTDARLAEDRLQLTGRLFPTGLAVTPERVVLTPQPAPSALPVVLSGGLAGDLGLGDGDTVSLTVGDAAVRAQLVGTVPDVPSVPGAPGVLADAGTLTRVLLAAGELPGPPQAWWVGGPRPGAALPGAVTRTGLADELRTGPLQVGLPTALALVAVGGALLASTGAVLQAAAVRSGGRAEAARLLGLGVPRRTVRGVVVARHVAGTVVAVLLGAVVGAVGTVLVAPAASGAAVPAATVQTPWVTWAVVAAGLALVGSAVVLPVARALVRVDVPAVLREGSS
ncbi:FtsX-like permease family protein [Klenkia brasiliensis]|uniref:FtsX-like permease family protein n=1 Tax=Klenkia brasiliensis TaxID=333142 RepID=A0A1G7SML8_9ACTN|nr:FtsX-like permease family protein [Klenkia brasiliensis]SDG24094.1 FtsX-like permease family protein [Klenkia brasiliensis]